MVIRTNVTSLSHVFFASAIFAMLDLDAEHYDNSLPETLPASSQAGSNGRSANGVNAAAISLADDELLTIEQVLPPAVSPAAVTERPERASTTEKTYYIQIIYQGERAFLRTNLPHTDTARTAAVGITWLMGRSRSCTIVFPDPAVSRCHAVIGHDVTQGFYVMDVGSSNGTFCNQKRLVTMQRQTIQNGDVLTISHIQIEIFLVTDDG
jgi:hypothetical protein